MQKINPKEISEARRIVEITQWDDNHPAWEAFLQKYGRQPHHTFEQAAAILLELTEPEFEPSDGMNQAGRAKYLEFFDMNPEEIPSPVFRAMMKEVCDG